MQRFAVGIEFCGTNYRGWQTQQPGVISVQETIEKVLSKIADEPIIQHGAGRTDAGVHATNMVAHFDTHALRSERGWLMGSNSQLPKDISIQWIKEMDNGFHARFKHRHAVIAILSITIRYALPCCINRSLIFTIHLMSRK